MLCLAVLKAVRSCNLRCPYCYFINEDTQNYGSFISEDTLRAFYRAVATYLGPDDQFEFVWHGGEPLILGKKRFRSYVGLQREYLEPHQAFNVVQTNGTLLDLEWIDTLEELGVGVGISLDGPPDVHDRRRPTVTGAGSYAEARRGLELLQARGHDVGVLSVVDPRADGRRVIRHLREIGVKSCDLLIPITNHCVESSASTSSDHVDHSGLTRYLVDAFREWSERHSDVLSVELFDALIQNAVGIPHGHLNAGSRNLAENVILETDGTLCLDPDFWHIDRFGFGQMYSLRTSVHDPEFRLVDVERGLAQFARDKRLASLPDECQPCSMRSICRASHPASRFHPDATFDHRSAYCPVTFELSQEVLHYLMAHGSAKHLVDTDLRNLVATAM